MFWKRKHSSSSFESPEIIYERKIIHTKSIVDRKLYDTEKSEIVSRTHDNRILFMTKKRNYFSCKDRYYDYTTLKEGNAVYVHEIIYEDIRQETEEYAIENIGKYNPDKYIELFGEVEEA